MLAWNGAPALYLARRAAKFHRQAHVRHGSQSRVVLLYQTLDGSETGAWDQRQGVWIAAADYQSSVRQGLRIARKQAAPDLLSLPVPAAEHGSERTAETAQ